LTIPASTPVNASQTCGTKDASTSTLPVKPTKNLTERRIVTANFSPSTQSTKPQSRRLHIPSNKT